MPQIGDTVKAEAIGKKGHITYIWVKCPQCKKERWAIPNNMRVSKKGGICRSCWCGLKGEESAGWKSGKHYERGYVLIYLYPDDFFYPMAVKAHYVLEHRLVMAKHLNRCLLPWEVVHHKGTKYPLESKENKGDNRLENLELLPHRGKHNININKFLISLQRENAMLRRRIQELECPI